MCGYPTGVLVTTGGFSCDSSVKQRLRGGNIFAGSASQETQQKPDRLDNAEGCAKGRPSQIVHSDLAGELTELGSPASDVPPQIGHVETEKADAGMQRNG